MKISLEISLGSLCDLLDKIERETTILYREYKKRETSGGAEEITAVIEGYMPMIKHLGAVWVRDKITLKYRIFWIGDMEHVEVSIEAPRSALKKIMGWIREGI